MLISQLWWGFSLKNCYIWTKGPIENTKLCLRHVNIAYADDGCVCVQVTTHRCDVSRFRGECNLFSFVRNVRTRRCIAR